MTPSSPLSRQSQGPGFSCPQGTPRMYWTNAPAFTALGDSHYLFSSFQSRLEKLTELTDSQKEACILQHRDLVYDCLFPAYNRLTAAVSALKDTGTNECGLCYYPDGKKYYEYIVKRGHRLRPHSPPAPEPDQRANDGGSVRHAVRSSPVPRGGRSAGGDEGRLHFHPG